jgi:hypothetical protein
VTGWKAFHSAACLWSGVIERRLFLATATAQRIKAAFDFACSLILRPRRICGRTQDFEIIQSAGRSDYEFVEPINIGETSLDLTGQFTDGITYLFWTHAFAPRTFLVVKSQAAFRVPLHHLNLNIAPANTAVGRQAGETVTLPIPAQTDSSITYGDSGAWPGRQRFGHPWN